jgi:hypothetical protein
MTEAGNPGRFDAPTVLYSLGLALLLGHELDAAINAKWRLLWVLKDLGEDWPATWFVWLHLPVFLAAIYLGQAGNLQIRLTFRRVVCIFLPIHAMIHFLLSGHPDDMFDHFLSDLLIYGAALCGMGYGIIWDRHQHDP